MAVVTCPNCLTSDVMPSMCQGFLENWLFHSFQIYRFRCARCLHRFPRRKAGNEYVPFFRYTSQVVWTSLIVIVVGGCLSLGWMAATTGRRLAQERQEKTPEPADVTPAPSPSAFRSVKIPDLPKNAAKNLESAEKAGKEPAAR